MFRFFFIPIYFKSKLYPWILMAFFLLLSGFDVMSMMGFFCGMGVGYLHVFKLLTWIEMSDTKAKRWENGAIISKLKSYSGTRSIFIQKDTYQWILLLSIQTHLETTFHSSSATIETHPGIHNRMLPP